VLGALRDSAVLLGNPPAVEIVRADALQYAASTKAKYDLIFLDPPFRKGWIARLAPLLPGLASERAAVYVEAETELAALGDWRTVRHGKAGEVHFHLMRRETA
jgi:16S rRNA (guanine966-N2)-methyltransferase